jgi:hypothetical protein
MSEQTVKIDEANSDEHSEKGKANIESNIEYNHNKN